MPKPPINLTNENLKEILETKSGMYLRSDTENFKAPEPLETIPPVKLVDLKKNFQDLAKSAFDENLNSGLYLRIKDLRKLLDEFEHEEEIDWNCIHLILRGATPVPEFTPESIQAKKHVGKSPKRVSTKQYSTYDGDESSYVGAKPGTPPFGEDV